MIFVTVGTHQQPFARLLEGLEGLDSQELVVQYGPASRAPRARHATPFMSFDEVARYMREARVVITHAGVGSILLAVRAGHVPVTVPRVRRYGEHVDDHQVQLALALQEKGTIRVVWKMDDLAAAVQETHRLPAAAPGAAGLNAAVRASLLGGNSPRR